MKRLLAGGLLALGGVLALGRTFETTALALAALGLSVWAAHRRRATLATAALAALALLAATLMGGEPDVETLVGAPLLATGATLLLGHALDAPPLHPQARMRGAILAGVSLLVLVGLMRTPLAAVMLNGPPARATLSLLLVAVALLLLASFGPVAGRRNADKGDDA